MLLVVDLLGPALGLATALLSAAAFNFFHLPPTGRFTIADSRNWVALGSVHDRRGRVPARSPSSRAARALEAERGRAEADLAAALARELLLRRGHRRALAIAARRIAEALGLRSAAIELGVAQATSGAERSRCATPTAPRSRPCSSRATSRRRPSEQLRERVVPDARGARRDRAQRRDALQAEAVETAALRRSDDIKTALLRAVSHDLRTPLTAIVAAGHALGTGSLTDEERAELSGAVVDGGERLASLVDNLLDLSRLQAGGAAAARATGSRSRTCC